MIKKERLNIVSLISSTQSIMRLYANLYPYIVYIHHVHVNVCVRVVHVQYVCEIKVFYLFCTDPNFLLLLHEFNCVDYGIIVRDGAEYCSKLTIFCICKNN